jgi:hypothetical protein
MPFAVSMIGIRSMPPFFQRTDDPVDGFQFVCGFVFRQDDAVQPGMHDGNQIGKTPFGGKGVDPHIELAMAGRFVSRRHQSARRGFLADGDRIFQVKDHPIRHEGKRFFDPTGMIAGREQQASHCAAFLAMW